MTKSDHLFGDSELWRSYLGQLGFLIKNQGIHNFFRAAPNFLLGTLSRMSLRKRTFLWLDKLKGVDYLMT